MLRWAFMQSGGIFVFPLISSSLSQDKLLDVQHDASRLPSRIRFVSSLFHVSQFVFFIIWCVYNNIIRYGHDPLFRGMHFEAILLIFQSIASYGCDVYSFGRASIWKPIDRVFASSFVLWECFKLCWLHMSVAEWITWAVSLSLSLYCFATSMHQLKIDKNHSDDDSLKGGKRNGKKRSSSSVELRRSRYLWWHTMWHISLPFGAGVWMMVRANRLYNR
jgi:hypothetical protein